MYFKPEIIVIDKKSKKFLILEIAFTSIDNLQQVESKN